MPLVFLYLNILSSLFSFDLRQDSHTNYRVIKPTTNKPPCGRRWLLLLILSVRVSLSKPTTRLVWIISSGSSKVQRWMQSWQEDVQERAATGLATFVVICWRKCQHRLWYRHIADAVIKDGGIRLLLDLAKSSGEDFDTVYT